MRFIFEFGGRSGIRDVEALAYALEAYNDDGRASFGRLLVDHSETKSGPGVEFRTVHALVADMGVAIQAAIDAKRGTGIAPNLPGMWADLALRYWTEAEAAELARVSPKPRRRRSPKGKRL